MLKDANVIRFDPNIHVQELETVARISTAAATILDAKELLQTVVDLVKTSFDLQQTYIYLFDEASADLVLAAGAGETGRALTRRGHRIPLNTDYSLIAFCVQRREGIIVNDVT